MHWPGSVNVRQIFMNLLTVLYVDNDANVAAGRKHKGAGQGADDVVAITLGTGLGGVLSLMVNLSMAIMDQGRNRSHQN